MLTFTEKKKKLGNDKGEEISNTGSHRRKMLSNINLQESCPCAHNQHSNFDISQTCTVSFMLQLL